MNIARIRINWPHCESAGRHPGTQTDRAEGGNALEEQVQKVERAVGDAKRNDDYEIQSRWQSRLLPTRF